MDIFDLSEIVAEDDEAVTTEMQWNSLLQTHVQCQPCGRQFCQIHKKGSTTGFVFPCPGCRRKEVLTTGSMLDGSHLANTYYAGETFYVRCRLLDYVVVVTQCWVTLWLCNWQLVVVVAVVFALLLQQIFADVCSDTTEHTHLRRPLSRYYMGETVQWATPHIEDVVVLTHW